MHTSSLSVYLNDEDSALKFFLPARINGSHAQARELLAAQAWRKPKPATHLLFANARNSGLKISIND
jgi:bifunctional DNase/RNase